MDGTRKKLENTGLQLPVDNVQSPVGGFICQGAFEEVLCRGIVQQLLQKRSVPVAVGVSAACGLHSIWNYILYSILGLNLRGNDESTVAVFDMSSVGDTLLNGGVYGIEASIITTAVLGVAVILLFYYLRGKPVWMYLSVAVSIFVLWFMQQRIIYLMNDKEFMVSAAIKSCIEEMHGILAFPLIGFYNRKKGKQLPKLFYYLFYPGHLLLILMVISLLP